MKRTLFLILAILTLTACGQAEPAVSATSTPVTPTATITPIPPTSTNTPEPTPTPLPYYLEDGSLYDLDESTGEYTLVGEGLAEISTRNNRISAINDFSTELFIYANGSWEETSTGSRWRFIAPPAEKDGELIYEKVTNWLAENELKQEDVKRLMTADGELPLGRVFIDSETATDEYGTNRCYSFLLGGVISLDEIYPGRRLLVMFNPDNPEDVEAGGQVLGFVLRDMENDIGKPSIGLMPSGSVLDVPHSRQWETTLLVNFYESDFIDVMEAGLGLDANEDSRGSWYGLQVSLGIQHLTEPGTYNSLDGVITGVDLDKNDDGLFDKYSGRGSYAGDILEMNYYYTLAMPDSYVDENMRNVILSHAFKRYD